MTGTRFSGRLTITTVPASARDARLYQTAPISTNLILAYIGQHVLGLPRSY
jgi:hypothetical protein